MNLLVAVNTVYELMGRSRERVSSVNIYFSRGEAPNVIRSYITLFYGGSSTIPTCLSAKQTLAMSRMNELTDYIKFLSCSVLIEL